MTCSEQLLLSGARYDVLHVRVIPAFIFSNRKACASDGQNVPIIEKNQG